MTTLAIVVIGRNDIAHLNRSLTAAARQCEEAGAGCRVLYADDASTDGSPDFAELLAARHPSLGVFRSPTRRNIGGVRNAAVELLSAMGEDAPEYVWLHDSDDFLAEGAVSRVLAALETNGWPDGLSVPIYAMRDAASPIPDCSVPMSSIKDAATGPVGEWSVVFRRALYVRNPEGQACEDAPWHFEQFDHFATWGRVEGPAPCYVWDCTNPNAVSRTADFCASRSFTLLAAACENTLVHAGKDDRWVSDNMRNLANMYDVRHRLKSPHVRAAWLARFKTEVANFATGFHVH